jgi:hypothetical protein
MMSTPGEFNPEGGVTRTVLDPATVKNTAGSSTPTSSRMMQAWADYLQELREAARARTSRQKRR